jgi:hypothetical protein
LKDGPKIDVDGFIRAMEGGMEPEEATRKVCPELQKK